MNSIPLSDLQKIRKRLIAECEQCNYMNPDLTKKLHAVNVQIAKILLKQKESKQ